MFKPTRQPLWNNKPLKDNTAATFYGITVINALCVIAYLIIY